MLLDDFKNNIYNYIYYILLIKIPTILWLIITTKIH
jgi:hypothetical protein